MRWDDGDSQEKDLLKIPENLKNYQSDLCPSWLEAMVLVHELIPFLAPIGG